jgi:hypothetical protein
VHEGGVDFETMKKGAAFIIIIIIIIIGKSALFRPQPSSEDSARFIYCWLGLSSFFPPEL